MEIVKLNDVLILTKYEEIDPGKLISDHFKSSYLNSYLKYLQNIKKLDLGKEKNKLTLKLYNEALKDYVVLRVNWINNYLEYTDIGYFRDDGGSLPKYYTPKEEYKIPSKKYLISLSEEELRDFLYTLPTEIKDG